MWSLTRRVQETTSKCPHGFIHCIPSVKHQIPATWKYQNHFIWKPPKSYETTFNIFRFRWHPNDSPRSPNASSSWPFVCLRCKDPIEVISNALIQAICFIITFLGIQHVLKWFLWDVRKKHKPMLIRCSLRWLLHIWRSMYFKQCAHGLCGSFLGMHVYHKYCLRYKTRASTNYIKSGQIIIFHLYLK